MKAINPIIIIDLRTWNWTGIGRVTHGIYSCAQELENDFDIFYIVNRGVTPSSKRNIIFRSKPFGLGEQFEFNKLSSGILMTAASSCIHLTLMSHFGCQRMLLKFVTFTMY